MVHGAVDFQCTSVAAALPRALQIFKPSNEAVTNAPNAHVSTAYYRDQPASGNVLSVHFDSGNPDVACSSWQQAVYIAAGSDPYALVDASVAAAAAIAGERHGGSVLCLPMVCLWQQQQQQQHWVFHMQSRQQQAAAAVRVHR
jgi:hypothetical protein